MAITNLSILFGRSGDSELGFFVVNSNAAALRRKFGAKTIPDCSLSVTAGSGSGQCSWLYWSDARSLAATTFDTFDLAGALTDPFGATITAATLKVVAIAISGPDGTKSLRFGPQNQSNAAQLGFGGTGVQAYETIFDWHKATNLVSGWTITATTADKVFVYNPGAGTIVYSILMAGT